MLDQILRLMHPFMPFITEEIWQAIPHEGEALIVALWPVYSERLSFRAEESAMESVMNAIRAVRNRRAELNVPPSKKSTLYIVTQKPEIFSEGSGFMTRLAYADRVVLCDSEPEGHESMVSCVTHDAAVYLPMNQLLDMDKELERIAKEREKAEKQLAGIRGKLSNEGFLSKAPEAVVSAERAKAEKLEGLLRQLAESEERMRNLQ